jgi:hypothetical protein
LAVGELVRKSHAGELSLHGDHRLYFDDDERVHTSQLRSVRLFERKRV